MRAIVLGIMVLAAACLVIGCSITRTVNTELTKTEVKKVKALSPQIKNVAFSFTRPNLYIRIDMREQPDDTTAESVVSSIKAFVNVDNMGEIARSAKWGLEISEVHLAIHTDTGNETAENKYFTRFFKTFDASDRSPANIDGYQTWYEE